MKRFAPLAALSLAIAAPAAAQEADRFAEVEIRVEQVAPGIAVLFGAGGNIGVSYGEDGTVLIDDQYAPLTERIEAAIAGLGAAPVRFLINTHWHGDHTGGNENFGEAGALIMAHDNVRTRLAAGLEESPFGAIPPAPEAALPVVTYHDGVKLHLNGDTVHAIHMHNGHTDGDSVILWENANVVHVGDLYFKDVTLPFIDRGSGGSAQGMLAAVERVLEMTDAETRIIPGHGPMATRADLQAYRDMLHTVIERVRSEIDAGKSLDEIQALGIADAYAVDGGFIDAPTFIGFVHDSLTDPEAMEHGHHGEGRHEH
ncbi:MAG: MBL fold metallo-hydrolase [Parasphingopyxis sp.]